MALRQLPHVVAADGGHQHVKPQFRVGDVAVKYNGKKVAGTLLQGSTTEVAEVTELVFTAGRLWTDAENDRAAMWLCLATTRQKSCSAPKTPSARISLSRAACTP